MKRALILLALMFATVTYCLAQDSAAAANDVTLLYRKEWTLGGTAHSQGFGILYRKGTHVTARKKRMLEAEFVSMRHPKQQKITNESVTGETKSFFFGKLNYVFIPRVGFGQQRVIFGKAEKSGVEVRYNFYGGIDLAFTKPVYNDVLMSDPSIPEPFKVVVTKRYDPDDPNQQYPTDFYGQGNFFLGFDKMKFYPGAYAKFSVSFEHATVHQKLAIIETGMVADFFLNKIPIMAYAENDRHYFNFYLSVLWGMKKN